MLTKARRFKRVIECGSISYPHQLCSRHHGRRRLVIIQQYYYPDISAVAQLLHQLVTVVSRQQRTLRISVLTGRCVRRPPGTMPSISDHVRVRRSRIGFSHSRTAVVSLLNIALFHMLAFFSVLLGPRQTVICLSTPPAIGFTVSLACRIRRLPLVVYIEDLYPELLFDVGVIRTSLIVKKMALLNRMTFHTARYLIVIGQSMKRKIRTNYGITKKIRVIPNWSSLEFEHAPTHQPRFDFLYSGNFGFGHTFTLLGEFFTVMEAVSPHLKLVGAGRRFGSVIKSVSRVVPTLTLSGYVSEEEHRVNLLAATFLIVTQDERTVGDLVPSKFYTYCAAGRPILFFGSRVSEIGNTIIANRLGAVVEVREDIDPVYRYIRRLVSDPEMYRKTCVSVRIWYRNHGGVYRAADQLMEVLNAL